MSYSFDIIGVTPVIQFFNHQQQVENTPKRSKAYVGSYLCTLDSFIEATACVHKKPDWDWDEVVSTIVNFWLNQADNVRHWKAELDSAERNSLIVGRIANLNSLRHEYEALFED